jgi:hypothetical protein
MIIVHTDENVALLYSKLFRQKKEHDLPGFDIIDLNSIHALAYSTILRKG